jgi:hypothetical protein
MSNEKTNYQLHFEQMTNEQIEVVAELLSDPTVLMNSLPEEEQQKYKEAQQSVVNARRAGERLAHELFIS